MVVLADRCFEQVVGLVGVACCYTDFCISVVVFFTLVPFGYENVRCRLRHRILF